MRKRLIWIAPLAMVGMAVFIGLGGFIVQQLWNWLLPSLFGWRLITFWQALGFLLLCRILFGSLGFHRGGPGSGIRRRMRERMSERWARMTPEEREAFRQGMQARWGCAPPGETKAE